jgi:ubiquinone/menaquinone biosynthesis C-methylase UbiE
MKSEGLSAPGVMRAVYDEAAESYDATRLNTPYKVRFDQTERSVLRRYLSGSKNVLEVGGGTGRLTGELLAASDRVTVVDIAPNMLTKLRQKYGQEKRLAVHSWNVFELDRLPGYGRFDALLCMRVLPHIEDIAKALAILGGAIRPGGLVMIDFWNRQSYVYRQKRGAKVFNNYVSYDEARRILANSGLELIALEGAGFGSPWNLNLEFLSRTPLKRIAYSLVAVCRRPNPAA